MGIRELAASVRLAMLFINVCGSSGYLGAFVNGDNSWLRWSSCTVNHLHNDLHEIAHPAAKVPSSSHLIYRPAIVSLSASISNCQHFSPSHLRTLLAPISWRTPVDYIPLGLSPNSPHITIVSDPPTSLSPFRLLPSHPNTINRDT